MLSEEMHINVHKMLVSVYMQAKLEGQDMSKHEESFNNSVEFLKQNGIKVGPDDLQNIMDKSRKLTWSRHQTSPSNRFGGYEWDFKT